MLPKNTFVYVIFVLKFYSYQTSRLIVPEAVAWMINGLPMIFDGPKGPFIYIAYMFSLLIRGSHVLDH